MGPHRSISNHRSHLSEITFDPVSATFGAAILPSLFADGDAADRPDDGRAALGAPPPAAGWIGEVFDATEARIRVAHRDHLGYPYNLVGRSPIPERLGHYLVNNLGDPYAGSHFASEVCDLEREAVAWLMDLWDCGTPEDYWGSVGASGTEGNLWALHLAREALPTARLLYSEEAHYSIPKSARILRIDAAPVRCGPDGAIDLAALAEAVAAAPDEPLILALTCGTTVKGAHDDIGGALACLDAAGLGPDRRFVHVDGALNAMVLPFVDGAPSGIRPSFRHAIDSLSTSGHKMIGTPMPCGVLIARRTHVERVSRAVAYLRSDDTTLMGSRNGHAVLAIWARFAGHGAAGFRADVDGCLARCDRLAAALTDGGVPALRNPHGLTVLFPQPGEELVRTFQLACHRGASHAIVMPNVTDGLIDRFLDGYLDWWRSAAGAARRETPVAPPDEAPPPALAAS